MAVISSFILQSDPGSMRLTAALTGLSGFLLLGYARDLSVSMPNLGQVKVELNLAEELFELILVAGFLVGGPIPKILTAGILGTLLFLKISIQEVANNLKMDLADGLGTGYRVYLLIGLIAVSTLNSYYMFYGSFVYLAIVLYDVGHVYYQFYENREGVKLKNRILSN
ncbi:MAG: hypothetical protein ABEK10_01475 [Candidatus Nanosalina sp.]